MKPFDLFKAFPELVILFSTRADGDMRVRELDDDGQKRRAHFFKSNGVAASRSVSISAAHAADVIRVGEREAGAVMKHVDGLITSDRNVYLSVTAADCLVFFLYDPISKTAGLLHAGWRGLARGIVSKALHQFQNPSTVRVGVSPFIQSCHFEVQQDVIAAFAAHPEAIIRRDDKVFVDLGAVALRQLLEAGVSSEYIEISEECTVCLGDRYFSYRRDGEPLHVMTAVLGMKE